MLIKGYLHYLLNAASAAWITIPGLLSILLLIAGIGVLVFLSRKGLKVWLAPALLVASAGSFTIAIYTAAYEIEQEYDYRAVAKEFPTDADCGAVWTNWFPAGAGLINPCGKGCYRGATLRQQMKMFHFPPWPKMRREIQCWVRSPREGEETTALLPD